MTKSHRQAMIDEAKWCIARLNESRLDVRDEGNKKVFRKMTAE